MRDLDYLGRAGGSGPSMAVAPALALVFTVMFMPVAGAADLPTESDYLQDLPTVLTGSRLDQPLHDTPVAMSIIDREMIEASGAREIVEVFRLVPGFVVGHHIGNAPFVTYHAMADRFARRLQVLVDGRSIYTPTFGGVPWHILPLDVDDIERIEISRGPNAAAYGANAFLATINIITRHPSEHPAGARLQRGSDGIYGARADLAPPPGDHDLQWHLSMGTRGDAGFEDVLERDVLGRQRLSDIDDSDLVWGRLGLTWDPGTGDVLSFRVGDAVGDLKVGRRGWIDEPPHDIKTDFSFEQLVWEREGISGPTHRISLYHQIDEQKEVFESLPIPPLGGATGTFDGSWKGERFDLEYQQTLYPTDRLRAVWGGSTRVDRVLSRGWLSRDEALENRLTRLFGHLEYRLGGAKTLQAGMMAEHHDITGTDLSPRIALNWRPRDGHSLRTSYSEAVRVPVIIEEFARMQIPIGPITEEVFLASGGLRPERIRSMDIGYLGRLMDGRLNLDVRLFYDEVYDLITFQFKGGVVDLDNKVADFRNRDHARIHGGETQLDFRPAPGSRLIFNYAYTDIDSHDIDETYSDSGPLHNASALYSRRFAGDWEGSVAWYWTSEIDGLDTGHPMPPQTRWDLRLAREFALLDQEAELAFVVQDAHGGFEDFRGSNPIETRIWATLQARF